MLRTNQSVRYITFNLKKSGYDFKTRCNADVKNINSYEIRDSIVPRNDV